MSPWREDLGTLLRVALVMAKCPDRPTFRSWPPAERHARAEHAGARISIAVPARRRG